jgi:hypothetical protein
MTLHRENNDTIEAYSSDAKSDSELLKDIEQAFDTLNRQTKIDAKQLLIYISATNGNINISGYDKDSCETVGDFSIWIEFNSIWQDNQNAYDFDELIVSTIMTALKGQSSNELFDKYELYYQTEIESATRIEKNAL